MGILGDTDKFNIAGDSTCMPTHASLYGKKICDCKLERGHSCDCKRKFLDPSASWGWDSYKELWFYGHSFLCFSSMTCLSILNVLQVNAMILLRVSML